MSKKFNKLKLSPHWQQYFSKYPQGYTIIENLIDWVSQVDDMVDNVNDWNEYLATFVETFDTNLQTKVTETLAEWQTSGFLDVVISEALQWELDNYITTNEQDKLSLTTHVDSEIERLEQKDENIIEQLTHTQEDINSRGVNLKTLGAVLDGVADDYDIVMDALNTYRHVIVPDGAIIGTTKTIFIDNGESLVGANPSVRGFRNTATIKYIGDLDRKKAVVVVGRNDVGAEPSKQASDCRFENFLVDANNLAGFGVYSTFLTNETRIQNIATRNSLEYDQYYARGWYATLRDLTSLGCEGKGIALGMPLEYLSGETVNWQTSHPLVLNNVFTENIRSISAGKHFSEKNPGTWRAENALTRRQGYGIGVGHGSGFRLNNFLSELSGGANLYSLTANSSQKTIESGYLEASSHNSGLTETEKAHLIIDNEGSSTGVMGYEIRDIFMSESTGGIYHIGTERKVWLRNIQRPRFLKTLNDISTFEMYSFILREGVHYRAGSYNTDVSLADYDTGIVTNSRYQFQDVGEDNMLKFKHLRTPKMLMVRNMLTDGEYLQPQGHLIVELETGGNQTFQFPENMTNEWTLMGITSQYAEGVRRGGATGTRNSHYELRVFSLKPTTV